MNVRELQRIVETGENQYIEFKHKVNFPEKVAREIVAFVNTKGGKILVGVDDNKNIFGLKNAEEEIFVIQKMIQDYIKFPIEYELEKIQISDKKDVIVIKVIESKIKPNYALNSPKEKFGIAYVRHKDQSIQASFEMLAIMRLDKKERNYIFTFDTESKQILQILDQEGNLSKKNIAEKLLFTEEKASEMLIKMCVSKVIKIFPSEKEDLFGV